MDQVNNLVKSILTLSNSEDGISLEEVRNQFDSAIADKVSNALEYAKVEIAHSLYKEEVEQVDEKAPPGAKYERMVKHIKAKYAKDGLTNKEKAIAYATAWKSYKKNEEVEQIDEAPISLRGMTPAQIAAKKRAASKFRDIKFQKAKASAAASAEDQRQREQEMKKKG